MNREKASEGSFLESNASQSSLLLKNTSNETISFNHSYRQSPKGEFRNPSSGSKFIYALDALNNRLWRRFIEPKSVDEDKKRREFILNVILCSFLAFLFLLTSIFIFNGIHYTLEYKAISAGVLSLVWGTFISLLYLSRKGYILVSSYGLIGLIILFSTLGALEWGFDLPAVIISYLLIIVISSILFDSRFGMIITMALSFLIILIGYYQIHIKIPNLYWRLENPEMVDTISFSVELFFIMAISWLSNHEMKKSLIRARKSEERLGAELERISQIYHFAEFGKLSSGAFHDLINPLTSISLNIHSLENSLHPDIQETKICLDAAIKASRRMENFIGAIEKQIKPGGNSCSFVLNEEIEQAIELLSYKARRAKCEIAFEAEENISTYGNQLAFYQTITNLISNAMDAYEGLEKKDRPINIILSRRENEIFIQIKDKGKGIEKAILPKVFDPFFTTKSFHKGIGLGLSTSKERMEKEFGGKISVVSDANYGTIFTISIPQRKSPGVS